MVGCTEDDLPGYEGGCGSSNRRLSRDDQSPPTCTDFSAYVGTGTNNICQGTQPLPFSEYEAILRSCHCARRFYTGSTSHLCVGNLLHY